MLTPQYGALHAAMRAYLQAFGPEALVDACKTSMGILFSEGKVAVADSVRSDAAEASTSVTTTDKRRVRKK